VPLPPVPLPACRTFYTFACSWITVTLVALDYGGRYVAFAVTVWIYVDLPFTLPLPRCRTFAFDYARTRLRFARAHRFALRLRLRYVGRRYVDCSARYTLIVAGGTVVTFDVVFTLRCHALRCALLRAVGSLHTLRLRCSDWLRSVCRYVCYVALPFVTVRFRLPIGYVATPHTPHVCTLRLR